MFPGIPLQEIHIAPLLLFFLFYFYANKFFFWNIFVPYLDLECIFTIICNLVKKPESLDEMLEMAKLLSTKIVQQPNDKPALRLKM